MHDSIVTRAHVKCASCGASCVAIQDSENFHENEDATAVFDDA